jgi:hypothetical protein
MSFFNPVKLSATTGLCDNSSPGKENQLAPGDALRRHFANFNLLSDDSMLEDSFSVN